MTAAGSATATIPSAALAGALVRRRRGGHPGTATLEVVSRAWLGRDAGIALVRAHGEALLVGFGRDGVRLLSRLGRTGPP
jgi:flagellar biogenesis protein FliO